MLKLLSVLLLTVFSVVFLPAFAATDPMSAAASAESPSKTATHKHNCHRHCHHHHAKHPVKKEETKTEAAPAVAQ